MGAFLERLGSLFYPRRCLFCDGVLKYSDQAILCENCIGKGSYLTKNLCGKCGKPLETGRKELCFDCNKKNHYYDQGRAMWLYVESVKYAITRFKYQGRRSYGKLFSEALYRFYLEQLINNWDVDLITSVPLYKTKMKKRSFNQAALIANQLGKKLDLPVNNTILIREKNTMPQKDLSDSQRIFNVKDAFLSNMKMSYIGMKILIIDDIYTTGSTIDECAKVLKENGASQVYCLTIAIGKGF